ncbi:MAG: hypothetical protein CEN89_430 [Candidatus Berkelbacteria bacterium Licking1014_7]|uniref:Uncharacterized protein n=1 Tax=Candidatus Berkelbacteria bacterium Licking1014_7 TaxID=2017147 RepID=A0A554LJ37_9BACT|nr:MAG: hypothetical protein CEN89_430 [Candidatus Berkelbacteria bacterium Licking1014_7]
MTSSELVATHKGKSYNYRPSTSELLLAKICRSFNMEFLPAVIEITNFVHLCRLSRPTIVRGVDNKEMLFVCQHTRFTPYKSGRFWKICERNIEQEGKTLEKATIQEIVTNAVKEDHSKERLPLAEVLEYDYYRYARVYRWPKSVYVAVYEYQETDLLIQPFHIHEVVPCCQKKLPILYLHFQIEPRFMTGGVGENAEEIYDSLRVDFPRVISDHQQTLHAALSLHPLNNLASPEQGYTSTPPQGFSARIHSKIPRELTMGFIGAYLRRFLQGNEF